MWALPFETPVKSYLHISNQKTKTKTKQQNNKTPNQQIKTKKSTNQTAEEFTPKNNTKEPKKPPHHEDQRSSGRSWGARPVANNSMICFVKVGFEHVLNKDLFQLSTFPIFFSFKRINRFFWWNPKSKEHILIFWAHEVGWLPGWVSVRVDRFAGSSAARFPPAFTFFWRPGLVEYTLPFVRIEGSAVHLLIASVFRPFFSLRVAKLLSLETTSQFMAHAIKTFCFKRCRSRCAQITSRSFFVMKWYMVFPAMA